jgi:hypothetical protein
MIIHPCEYQFHPIPGTRLLEETFGLVGESLQWQEDRPWTILGFYIPMGVCGVSAGVRTRIRDSKRFYSFINQRDLELLLDPSLAGKWCKWMGEDYPELNSVNWYGPCVDTIDLQDDLFALEQELRHEYGEPLPPLSVERRIHDDGSDWERDELLLQDVDLKTGMSPDPRLETIGSRWVTSERRKVTWRRL